MSDLVENGGNRGLWPLPPSEHHDEYLELSALSTTDLLTTEERRRLDEHLHSCQSCREIHAQYRALVDVGIPTAVSGVERNRAAQSVSDTELDEGEAALFACLDQQELQVKDDGLDRNGHEHLGKFPTRLTAFPREMGIETDDRLWRAMWWQFAAATLLLVALGSSVYRAGLRRGAEQAAVAAARAHPEPARGPSMFDDDKERARATAALAAVRDEENKTAALRAQLSANSAKIARLEMEKAALEQNLRLSQSGQDQQRRNAESLNRQLAAEEEDLAGLRQRFSAVSQWDSEQAARVAALRQQLDDLKKTIGGQDQEIAREQELLDHDRDIRELMGSRNLYIAEVYDVARNGHTQKPFGRVFYTKNRSLIFYAYDLDQQPGVRDSSTFQAWGSRGPDRSDAISLGIFYQDKAARKRWIVKAEGPKALSGLDAVFVTVEPPGGSTHPSGKPLLFAYLHTQPNHP